MKVRYLFLTLFLTICYNVNAQVDSFQEDIVSFLNDNGTRGQFDNAYESMFDLLKDHFEASNVPETVWAKLKQDKEQSLDELVNSLANAFRKKFSHDEIKRLDVYSQTEASKLKEHDPQSLTQSQQAEVTAFNESNLGRKVESVGPELLNEIVAITESWSQELYTAKLSFLMQKGYATEH